MESVKLSIFMHTGAERKEAVRAARTRRSEQGKNLPYSIKFVFKMDSGVRRRLCASCRYQLSIASFDVTVQPSLCLGMPDSGSSYSDTPSLGIKRSGT